MFCNELYKLFRTSWWLHFDSGLTLMNETEDNINELSRCLQKLNSSYQGPLYLWTCQLTSYVFCVKNKLKLRGLLLSVNVCVGIAVFQSRLLTGDFKVFKYSCQPSLTFAVWKKLSLAVYLSSWTTAKVDIKI